MSGDGNISRDESICPDCDLRLATQHDYDACDHDCPTCEKCAAVCWSVYNLTGCAHPIDWRARATTAERERDAARAALVQVRDRLGPLSTKAVRDQYGAAALGSPSVDIYAAYDVACQVVGPPPIDESEDGFRRGGSK